MATKRLKRDPKVKKEFLKKRGLERVPQGKVVDHKVPLADGGSDSPRNIHIIKKKLHNEKTAREARARAKKGKR